jgi:hypothetical protein
MGAKVLICLFVVLMSTGFTMSIAALVVRSQNEGNPCVTNSGLMSIGYLDWLLGFGVSSFVANSIATIIGIIYIKATSDANQRTINWSFGLLVLINLISGLFQLAWYIVGAILYFTEIHDSCPARHSLRDFGLSLFIIQSVSLACTCFSKTQSPSQN